MLKLKMQVLNRYECGYISHFIRMLKVIPKEINLNLEHTYEVCEKYSYRSGELKAPIVFGRDHLDSGSVASPNRETEGMKDGSDAVSDWPILNAVTSSPILFS